jgi:hypothetical protein
VSPIANSIKQSATGEPLRRSGCAVSYARFIEIFEQVWSPPEATPMNDPEQEACPGAYRFILP